jgi:pimeloyl-ACP methyl ester carboxylesterase
MRTTMKGLQVAYTDEGKGIPLVLVHGFPLNRGVWANQVEAFKGSYRVIAPDLCGFGESEAVTGAVSMSRFAEDLHALLQYLGTGPVILIGHSMGGYVALAFAKAFPRALHGLVLVGTKAGADAPEGANARRATAERVRMEGSAPVVGTMAPGMLSASNRNLDMAASVHAFMTPANPQGMIGALLGMADRPDADAWLGSIHTRTLVIAGQDDSIIPPSEAEALMMAIPGAQLRLIPRAGHLVAFEQADAFNETLWVWLSWGS